MLPGSSASTSSTVSTSLAPAVLTSVVSTSAVSTTAPSTVLRYDYSSKDSDKHQHLESGFLSLLSVPDLHRQTHHYPKIEADAFTNVFQPLYNWGIVAYDENESEMLLNMPT